MQFNRQTAHIPPSMAYGRGHPAESIAPPILELDPCSTSAGAHEAYFQGCALCTKTPGYDMSSIQHGIHERHMSSIELQSIEQDTFGVQLLQCPQLSQLEGGVDTHTIQPPDCSYVPGPSMSCSSAYAEASIGPPILEHDPCSTREEAQDFMPFRGQ